MSELDLLDRTYHAVMRSFVATGRAPHYTELATQLGVPLEQARGLLHELVETGLPGWMEPGQDVLVSLAPFSNLPTHYRLTIEGRQSWFAQ